jgi:hypothetical protein
MTSEACRLLIAQYLAGQLMAEEKSGFEEQVAADAELLQEVEELRELWDELGSLPQEQPSPVLRARFYQRLNALEREGRAAPVARASWWNLSVWKQVAAAVLVFGLGMYLGQIRRDEGRRADEMVQMRAQVQGLREMVALSLLERQSATSRLEGVAWTSRVDQPKEELLSALIGALNHDSNVNVRLSSLNALERFAENSMVDKALVDSLERQDSPLVQIALIDLLVHVRNRAAEPEFKKLTATTEVNPAVKQRAQWALQRLSLE